MATGTFSVVASWGGITISPTLTVSGDHPNPFQLPLPIAWAGTITGGTVTLPAGHAIVTGTVDAYWTDPATGLTDVRYGCSATVSGTSVALTGGTGTALPGSGYAITLGQVVQFTTEIVSADVQAIIVSFDHLVGHALLETSGGDSVLPVLLPLNQPWFWVNGNGTSNPLTSSVGLCQASNGDPTSTATLTILSMENV